MWSQTFSKIFSILSSRCSILSYLSDMSMISFLSNLLFVLCSIVFSSRSRRKSYFSFLNSSNILIMASFWLVVSALIVQALAAVNQNDASHHRSKQHTESSSVAADALIHARPDSSANNINTIGVLDHDANLELMQREAELRRASERMHAH